MGKKKKTTKNSEKKPSHKWRKKIHKTRVAASSKKKQKQKKNWREERQEKLEGLLQLGLNMNDEPVQRLNKEIEDISRQRKLARELIKVPLKPPFCRESISLLGKMYVSARENVPEAVLLLLEGLMKKFGRSYKMFVWHLGDHIWLKVHMRCLQEDAGLVGQLSDEAMTNMKPRHVFKLLLDGSAAAAVASGERKMKVLVSEFGLNTPCSYPVQDIIAELVEKMANAFAEVAPHDAKAVFAKVAEEDAMDRAMGLALQGISLDK